MSSCGKHSGLCEGETLRTRRKVATVGDFHRCAMLKAAGSSALWEINRKLCSWKTYKPFRALSLWSVDLLQNLLCTSISSRASRYDVLVTHDPCFVPCTQFRYLPSSGSWQGCRPAFGQATGYGGGRTHCSMHEYMHVTTFHTGRLRCAQNLISTLIL